MRISIEESISLLLDSEVIGLPTETVYGLAGLARDPVAIEKIYRLKKRPSQNPLILHIHSRQALLDFKEGEISHLDQLAALFWPGPLTLVIPVKPGSVPELARAGLPTAAFRVPQLELTRKVLISTGPLVAPSANLSGKPSATLPEHVEADFGINFPVLYSDRQQPSLFGLESTILIYRDETWYCGRLGALPLKEFEAVLGYIPPLSLLSSSAPICPGQLFRHYAPDALITLGETGWAEKLADEYEWVVGFPERSYPGARQLLLWGSEHDPLKCARDLYKTLRELDTLHVKKVFWDFRFNRGDDWLALIERLNKASSR